MEGPLGHSASGPAAIDSRALAPQFGAPAPSALRGGNSNANDMFRAAAHATAVRRGGAHSDWRAPYLGDRGAR